MGNLECCFILFGCELLLAINTTEKKRHTIISEIEHSNRYRIERYEIMVFNHSFPLIIILSTIALIII